MYVVACSIHEIFWSLSDADSESIFLLLNSSTSSSYMVEMCRSSPKEPKQYTIAVSNYI